MKRRKRAKNPGIRLSTLMRDKKILRLLKTGLAPKEIVYKMGLGNVWLVYHAIKRDKL